MSHEFNHRKLVRLGWLLHLGGLLAILSTWYAYQFFVSDVIAQREFADATEIARLEKVLEIDRNPANDVAELKAELKRLEARAESARQWIPETPQEGEFLAQLSEAARKNGLQLGNFTRGAVAVLDTHSQLQVRLTGEGDYASICKFFAEMESLSRVATISRMSLSAASDANTYPLDMTLTLYFGAKSAQGGNRG